MSSSAATASAATAAAVDDPRGPQHPAVVLAVGCAVFIVYGSLFPFDFRAGGPPFSSIFADWRPWQNRSDAIDNVALFVPLGAALFFACRTARQRWCWCLASVALLGFGLQVLQLQVPSRVASLADTINNAIGLTLGLGLARAAAPWMAQRQLLGRRVDPMALMLVGAWYVYESFPLVPTLDVGLLAGHIKPMLALPAFEPGRLLRHALAALLGTLALLAARPLASRRAGLWACGALLLGSEILVPYGELRLEALAGIGIGIGIADRLERALGPRVRWAVVALAVVALGYGVTTPLGLPASSGGFTFTPFSHLFWQGSTAGIPTAAFEALAIGSLMWAGGGRAPLFARAWAWPALGVVAVLGAEGLRLALGSGEADSSSFVTALVLAPFAAASHRRRDADDASAGPVVTAREPVPVPVTVPAEQPVAPRRRAPLWLALATLAALTLGLRLLLSLPGLPYNVLELIPERSLWRVALFALALLWLGAGPWWVAQTAARRRAPVAWLALLLPAAGLISLALLRLAVTQESLDDITGSTDLYRRVVVDGVWGEAWRSRLAAVSGDAVGVLERGVRYVALYGLLLLPLSAVTIAMSRDWPLRRALPAWLLIGVLAAGAQWIVVDQAITDNLTELIAEGGVPWLMAGVALFAVNVGLLARLGQGWYLRRWLPALALTLLALPLGAWLGTHGLEQVIVKYDAVWSAQQFLLGRNRTTHLAPQALFERWCAVYLTLLCVCALGLALARRLWPATAKAVG